MAHGSRARKVNHDWDHRCTDSVKLPVRCPVLAVRIRTDTWNFVIELQRPRRLMRTRMAKMFASSWPAKFLRMLRNKADTPASGLTHMAASQGVTRIQLIWIADANIHPEILGRLRNIGRRVRNTFTSIP